MEAKEGGKVEVKVRQYWKWHCTGSRRKVNVEVLKKSGSKVGVEVKVEVTGRSGR